MNVVQAGEESSDSYSTTRPSSSFDLVHQEDQATQTVNQINMQSENWQLRKENRYLCKELDKLRNKVQAIESLSKTLEKLLKM